VKLNERLTVVAKKSKMNTGTYVGNTIGSTLSNFNGSRLSPQLSVLVLDFE
jgi:hypothetical protein